MSEFIYTFVGMANRFHEETTCLKGMRLLSDTLHPHGVKITWIVSPGSAKLAAKELTEWHERYGDDIAVATPEQSAIPSTFSGNIQEKKKCFMDACAAIKEALPWANPVIATGHNDPDIVQLCEELGFEGVWGFCWEQIEVDGITDRGCPWGFYYMDEKDRLRPRTSRGPVAMEWTSRDLLKAFHSGNPCVYSSDPNDPARAGLCRWENIDYWKAFADNYIRNTRYNEQVFLVQEQEAHEMERGGTWFCYTEEDIREAAVLLEEFVKHIKPHATMMTLAEAVRAYKAQNEKTASSYMLWEDTPHAPLNPDYAWDTCAGPWPKTFMHYDCGAQMMFVQGQVRPVCIRNYNRPWDNVGYYEEPVIPRPRLEYNTQYHWSRELSVSVEAPCDMPYGMALWGDYSLYQIAEAPGLVEGKILQRELLFLRYDLKKGKNTFVVKLQGK